MVQPEFSNAQTVTTTPPWNCATPVPGPPMGPAGGALAGMYPNPTIAPGVIPTTLPPMGPAGGDLNGTYPNPLVDGINGAPVGTTTPLVRGDLLVANATPTFSRLALGAATMQLQSNGTDVVWGYPLGGPPSGPAGGALTGTYPNPGVTYSAITGTPTSLPPSGAASGDLQGTYPSPSITAAAKSKWTETIGLLTPVTTTDMVAIPGSGTTGESLRLGSRTIKGRAFYSLLGSYGTFYITNNAAPTATTAITQDDTLHSGWAMLFEVQSDTVRLQRSPPGSTAMQDVAYFTNIGDLVIIGANATKASGTTWANPSDPRLKENVAPYTAGLAEILALAPITFQFNGLGGTIHDGTVCHGFDASVVQPVMPEMVRTRMAKLHPDDTEDTELLWMDQTALPLALVNAVKELADRVTALEKGKP